MRRLSGFDYVMLGGGSVGVGLIFAATLLGAGGCKAQPVTGTFATGGTASSGVLILVDTPAGIPAAVKACPLVAGGPPPGPNAVIRCTVKLAPGNWGEWGMRSVAPASQVMIDVTGSTFSFAYLPADANLTINGGEVVGGNSWGQCWLVDGSTNVTLQNGKASNCAQAGFILTRSRGVNVLAWTMINPGCDGVDVAGVDGFIVAGGNYLNYAGGACHADAVQMWGMAGYPLQHGKVLNNIASSLGNLNDDGRSRGSQGFDDFNNNAPGGGQYPTDDIQVSGNTAYSYGGWCVALGYITHVVAKNNQCINMQPEPWKGRYSFQGSSGVLGPNWQDSVEVYGSTRQHDPGPPWLQGGRDLHLGPPPQP